MNVGKVTSKGQVTIPVAIREQLGIAPGDQLVFNAGPDGLLAIRVRRPKVGAGRGMIPGTGSQINRGSVGSAVADGVANRLERSARKRRRERGT